MIVVGGIYQEVCREPRKWNMFGSGLRAAGALAGVCKDLTLLSAISPGEREWALAVSSGLGLPNTKLIDRNSEVKFIYDTPLSVPIITGISSTADILEADGKVALVFGMIEAKVKVDAGIIIYDPQNPHGPIILDRNYFKCDKFAVVGNVNEIKLLGNSEDLMKSSENIISSYNADVVVIKNGPFGSLVITKNMVERIAVHVTEKVWPIGSGDIFSAIFAWSWGIREYSPLDSAKLASLGTAYWCCKQTLPIPLLTRELDQLSYPLDFKGASEVQVYLAGPFFNISERWLVNLIRESLLGLGAKVFSPFHEVGLGGDETALKDIGGLEKCNSVLAILDNCDPGTIFEVGYAKARNIPVIGFCQNIESKHYQMIRGLDIPLMDDLSSCIYNAIWAGLK